jgi:uncharacterized low-complexity protein
MSKKVNLALAMTTAMGISVAATPVVQASPFGMKDLAQGYDVKAAEAAKEAKPADAKPAKKDEKAKDATKGEAGKCGGAGKCGADKKPK